MHYSQELPMYSFIEDKKTSNKSNNQMARNLIIRKLIKMEDEYLFGYFYKIIYYY